MLLRRHRAQRGTPAVAQATQAPADVTVRPTKSAPKAAWITHVIALGATEEDVKDLKKDDLLALADTFTPITEPGDE